jgi:hypothetical protein
MNGGAWPLAGLLAAVACSSAACELVAGLGGERPYPADAGTTLTSTGGAGGNGGAQAGGCSNGVKDGNETGKDCGGSCPTPCAVGGGCVTGSDCESHVCSGGTCLAPICDDKAQNGTESDVDCGGTTCPPCGPDKGCLADADCVSKQCAGGLCASICTDGLLGGDESDVDCGGSCPACADDKHCVKHPDCTSGLCATGVCLKSFLWQRSFPWSTVSMHGLASDAAGNTVFSGHFNSNVDLGGGLVGTTGGEDVFVAKYDPSGAHVWSGFFTGAGDQRALGMATYPTGQIALVGAFQQTMSIGSASLVSAGGDDAYLAKLSTDGGLQWTSHAGDSQAQVASAIALDQSGAAFFAGSFGGSVKFGATTLLSAGASDLFLAKVSASGITAWGKRFGDVSDQSGAQNQLAVDQTGAVILAASANGTIDFGNGPLTSAGQGDVFLAKFDTSGAPLWSKRFGDAGQQGTSGIAVDDNNIIVAGNFQGSVDFGGGALTNAGGNDFYVAKFDPMGNHLWSQRYGDVLDQFVSGVATDPAGNIAIAGYFRGAIDFGNAQLSNNGPFDVFVAKLDPTGGHFWSRQFGDSGIQVLYRLALADQGSLLLGGYFSGTIDFGGGPMTSMTGFDRFLAKIRTP